MPSENPAEPIPKAALKRSKLMNDPEVRLERLGPQHALDEFECGHADLDTWLKRHALAAQQMDSARTFVLVEGDRVIGYFSLTMGSVLRAEAPGKLVRGLPSYPVGMGPARPSGRPQRGPGTGPRRIVAGRGVAKGGERR